MRMYPRLAILLFGIAFFTLFFGDTARLVIIAATLVFRNILRFTLPALEMVAEHAVRSRALRLLILVFPVLGTLRIWARFHIRRCRTWWKGCSPRKKFLLGFIPAAVVLCVGLASGSILGAIAVMSIVIPRAVAALTSALSFLVRWLAKRAAMRTAEPGFDAVWKRIPAGPRRFVDRAYGRLWYWTMFKIARSRKRAVRYAERGRLIVIVWAWLTAAAPRKRARRT